MRSASARLRDMALALSLVAAGLAGSAVSARLSTEARPLYDGLCAGDQYRFLHPPNGLVSASAPTSATKSLAILGGASQATVLTTGETPPQAQLLLPDASLAAPPGSAAVTLSIDPVDPPADAPATGMIAGNVYRVSARDANGAAVGLAPGKVLSIVLRSPAVVSTSAITVHTSSGWKALQTSPLGCASDTLSANAPSFGDFAVVNPLSATAAPSAGAASGGGTGGSSAVPAIGGVAAVAVVIGAALWVARRRRVP